MNNIPKHISIILTLLCVLFSGIISAHQIRPDSLRIKTNGNYIPQYFNLPAPQANPNVGFYNIENKTYTSADVVNLTAWDRVDAGGYITPGFVIEVDADANGRAQNYLKIFLNGDIVFKSPVLYNSRTNRIIGQYLNNGDWLFEWCDKIPDGAFPYIIYNNADNNINAQGTYNHNNGQNCFQTDIGEVTGIAVFSGNGVENYFNGTGKFVAKNAGPGTHTITYCWDNEKGFSDCTTQTVDVIAPQAEAGENEEICNGAEVAIGGEPTAWSGAGKYEYNWQPANSLNDNTLANPMASPAETTTYYLTVTDNNGKGFQVTDSVTVYVNPPADAKLTYRSNHLCTGDTLQILANENLQSFQWSGNVEYLSNISVTNPVFKSAQSGVFSISFYGVDENNCKISDEINITTNPKPTMDLGNDAEICDGETFTIIPNATEGNFLWSNGVSSPTLSVNTTGNYSLVVTNSFGCSASDEINITTNPKPPQQFPADTFFCANSFVELSGNDEYKYKWNGNAQNSVVKIQQSGIYTVEISSIAGCRTTQKTEIEEKELPKISLGNDTSICRFNYLLMDAGTNHRLIEWNTGGNSRFERADESGEYIAKVYNEYCSNSDTLNLTINELPVIHIADQSVCENDSAYFEAEQASSYYWWPVGSNAQSIYLKKAGMYRLTITDENNCSYTERFSLTVNRNPELELNDTLHVCHGEKKVIKAPAGYAYHWNTNEITREITVSESRIYTLEITNEKGCQTVDSTFLSVLAPIEFSLGDNKSFCKGDSVLLSAPDVFTNYQWSTHQNINEITVRQAGKYSLEVTDGNGCPASDEITVTELQTPEIELGSNIEICDGKTHKFEVEAAFETYTWNTGSTKNSINANKTAWYKLSVTNKTGCSATDSVFLNVNQLPEPKLDTEYYFCSGDTLSINANGDFENYFWNNQAGDKTFSTTQTGNLTLAVTDNNGCSNSTATVLKKYGLPILSITDTLSFCSGNTVQINTSDSYTVYWRKFGIQNPVKFYKAGTYHYNVSYGESCIISDSVIVQEFELPLFELGNDTVLCNSEILQCGVDDIYQNYIWNTGSKSSQISIKKAGKYTLTAINKKKCEYTDTIVVERIELPGLKLPTKIDKCPNEFIELEAAGGFDSYTWNTGDTLPSIKIKKGDTYRITACKNICCTTSQIMVTNYEKIRIEDIKVTEEKCTGSEDGRIEAVVWPNKYYKFSLNNEQTYQDSPVFENLAHGNYNLVVQDTNKCKIQISNIEISSTLKLKLGISVTDIDCATNNYGKIELNVSGGSPPYYLSLNSDEAIKSNRYTFGKLTAGDYSVSVTDFNGCKTDSNLQINEPQPIIIDSINIEQPDCFGYSSGKIEIVAAAGNSSFRYSIDNGKSYYQSNTFDHLTEGQYKIVIKDSKECMAKAETVFIEWPSPLLIDIIIAENAYCNETANGKMTIIAKGGTPPYRFSHNAAYFAQNNSFSNLLPANYTVVVKDSKQCVKSKEVKIAATNTECLNIPTAFSPNNDGINDFWAIENLHLYPESIVKVYDRNSRLVFAAKTSDFKWNGQYNGYPLPAGSYFYILVLRPNTNAIRGYITIIR